MSLRCPRCDTTLDVGHAAEIEKYKNIARSQEEKYVRAAQECDRLGRRVQELNTELEEARRA